MNIFFLCFSSFYRQEKANKHLPLHLPSFDFNIQTWWMVGGLLYLILCFQNGGWITTFDQQRSVTVEFDGASKGNPGRAGAGAVLRSSDGSEICRVRQGMGNQTNNAAEYQGMIIGMKEAFSRGYEDVRVQGDSQLVCEQMNDAWRVKSQNLKGYHSEARELKNSFKSCVFQHVPRGYNADADAQANKAVNLPDGYVEKDY